MGVDTPDDQPVDLGELDAVPTAGTTDYDRYEAAPEGVLIPIPSEAPAGNVIRDDAQITVSPLQASGYYVAIYNGPADSGANVSELVGELLTEAGIAGLEQLVIKATAGAVSTALIKFASLGLSVIISVFTPSPILRESVVRSKMEDGTAITYAVLDPQD